MPAEAVEPGPRPAVRVLSAGVDSLYATVADGLDNERFGVVLRHRGAATDKADDTVFEVPGTERTFLVKPHGYRRYPVWMSCPAMDVMVGADDHRPPVLIQLRSAFLHQVGAEAAVEDAQRVAAFFCPGVEAEHVAQPVMARRSSDNFAGGQLAASRVDLYADTQGWTPEAADLDRFACRAVRRKLFEEPRDEPRQLHVSGRNLSGFTFGRGAVMARIYNKTLELKSRQADWPAEIWQQMDATQPVWRVEFQFRREALKDFRSGVETVHSVADVLALRQGLWEYGTHWLSLRREEKDTNRARWEEDEVWEQIRAAVIGSPHSGLVRARIRQGDQLRLVQGLVGYASSLAATGYGNELEEAMSNITPLARAYLEHRGRDFTAVTARKRERARASR